MSCSDKKITVKCRSGVRHFTVILSVSRLSFPAFPQYKSLVRLQRQFGPVVHVPRVGDQAGGSRKFRRDGNVRLVIEVECIKFK